MSTSQLGECLSTVSRHVSSGAIGRHEVTDTADKRQIINMSA